MTNTQTKAVTSTFSRTDIVVSQYELALKYAGLKGKYVDNLIEEIKNQNIEAVGIYAFNEKEQRVCEVEITVDWEQHIYNTKFIGEDFDFDQAGVGINEESNGLVALEYMINKMIGTAKEKNLELHWWYRIKKDILKAADTSEVTRIRKCLSGNPAGKKVADWDKQPTEQGYSSSALSEVKITGRSSLDS